MWVIVQGWILLAQICSDRNMVNGLLFTVQLTFVSRLRGKQYGNFQSIQTLWAWEIVRTKNHKTCVNRIFFNRSREWKSLCAFILRHAVHWDIKSNGVGLKEQQIWRKLAMDFQSPWVSEVGKRSHSEGAITQRGRESREMLRAGNGSKRGLGAAGGGGGSAWKWGAASSPGRQEQDNLMAVTNEQRV